MPILQRVNELGAEGWEFISPLDISVVEIEDREANLWARVVVWLSIPTIIGPYIWMLIMSYAIPDKCLILEGATLTFRRRR